MLTEQAKCIQGEMAWDKKMKKKSESAFGAQTPAQYILQYERIKCIRREREHKHKAS